MMGSAPKLRIATALALLPLLLLPGTVRGAVSRQPAIAATPKSLSLRLSEVQHIYGSRVVTQPGAATRKGKDIACANAPTVEYDILFAPPFGSPALASGLISVNGVLYQYKDSSGPRCSMKSDLFMRKMGGDALGGHVTTLKGVGDQAALVRIDPPKHSPGSPVYALSSRVIRGRYLSIVLVMASKKINAADVTNLAKAVDGRIKQKG